MPQFTVIQPGKVVRVQAKSIQALTRSLKAAGQRWLGIHEDLEPTIENLAAKVNS